jgi:hypothetical protein
MNLQTLKCTTTPVERWTVCTERLERRTERWTFARNNWNGERNAERFARNDWNGERNAERFARNDSNRERLERFGCDLKIYISETLAVYYCRYYYLDIYLFVE